MHRSEKQILCTHIGSFGRPPDLLKLLMDRHEGRPVDEAALAGAISEGVTQAFRRQVEIGITVPNDGEQSKISYAGYLKDRLSGIEMRDMPQGSIRVGAEEAQFPEYYRLHGHRSKPIPGGATKNRYPCCVGPLAWKDFSLVEQDIANLRAASAGAEVADVFMTAPSPSVAAVWQPNMYYKSEDEYRYAVADAMKREYDAIVAAGFILQIDCPDLMMVFRMRKPGSTLEQFRERISRNIEILNHATRDIPPERARIHVCCGAGQAPHTEDPPLEGVIDILLRARPQGLTFVAANGRHEHEWRVWEKVRLPEGKIIIPGVIDSTTNIVEHPETVADRIERFAKLVGRENVIAGVDCGFDTTADYGQVVPEVAWAKLAALGEGARVASRRLWPS
ncbi:MAG: cobalamin-independent methionine synthase II family protein [Gammaproteobacteria bacterium]